MSIQQEIEFLQNKINNLRILQMRNENEQWKKDNKLKAEFVKSNLNNLEKQSQSLKDELKEPIKKSRKEDIIYQLQLNEQ